jgi:GNAT superfamily N-acetyltransferase
MDITLALARDDATRRRCWPILRQLRPHLDEGQFLEQARRQTAEVDWRLLYAEHGGEVVGCAGFRISEYLAHGRTLYLDDLVTDEGVRGSGVGRALMGWLVEHARAHGCAQLHLDSGVQRFGAHRFYLMQGMHISAHHFALDLRAGGQAGAPSPGL